MIWSITQYGRLNDKQKFEAVNIFTDSFGRFMKFTRDRTILRSLFYYALNPVYTYALVENETVIGILGLSTNKSRSIKFDIDNCVGLLGKVKGTLFCKEMNAFFQSQVVENDTELYIDMLATARHSRGKGVATKLLKHCFNLQGYRTYYIEVMSKNINAKRLYEKMGFVEDKKRRVSPMALRGCGYPIIMKKEG